MIQYIVFMSIFLPTFRAMLLSEWYKSDEWMLLAGDSDVFSSFYTDVLIIAVLIAFPISQQFASELFQNLWSGYSYVCRTPMSRPLSHNYIRL